MIIRYPWYMRSKASKLQGLIDLITFIHPIDIVVEIGSYMGESSILWKMKSRIVYCIDTWENKKPKLKYSDMENIEKEYDKRIKEFPGIKKIKGKSTDIAKFFADNSIGLLYIDGDHGYKAVKKDIQLYLRKVKIDGYICIHDCRNKQIKKAYEETIGKYHYHFEDKTALWIKNRIEGLQ